MSTGIALSEDTFEKLGSSTGAVREVKRNLEEIGRELLSELPERLPSEEIEMAVSRVSPRGSSSPREHMWLMFARQAEEGFPQLIHPEVLVGEDEEGTYAALRFNAEDGRSSEERNRLARKISANPSGFIGALQTLDGFEIEYKPSYQDKISKPVEDLTAEELEILEDTGLTSLLITRRYRPAEGIFTSEFVEHSKDLFHNVFFPLLVDFAFPDDETLIEELPARNFKKIVAEAPTNYILAYQQGVWAFRDSEHYRTKLDELEKGDVILFELTTSENGPEANVFVGFGLFYDKGQKDDFWFPDEKVENELKYPLYLRFSDTYWLGNVDQISDTPFDEKSNGQISNEEQYIGENAVSRQEIIDATGYHIPQMNLESVNQYNQEIIEILLDRGDLSHRSYEREVDTNIHAEKTYFILKTGADEYEDRPNDAYHFREGIPGSKQLREAVPNVEFVYLEGDAFYGTGRISNISEEERDGVTHYFGKVEDYAEIDPVPFDDVREHISPDFPIQYGIIKITKVDFETITGSLWRGGSPSPETGHTLLDHLERHKSEITVYRLSCPPEYWLSTISRAVIGLGDDHRDTWEEFSRKDIILFYNQRSDVEGIEHEVGFIGAGVVRTTAKKPENTEWWWDEIHEGDDFPYLISFERLYFTGDVENVVARSAIPDVPREELQELINKLTKQLLPLAKAETLCEEHAEVGLAVSGTISPFRRDNDPELHRPRILLKAMADDLTEAPSISLTTEFRGSLEEFSFDGLHFEDGASEQLIEQIQSALLAGKHLVFTGPPGTGKTEIARQISQQLVGDAPYLYSDFQLTTATADWSTFDTVGGYMPEPTTDDGDALAFTSGVVLNRFKSRESTRQRNELLIIDELNRADIDKAFGQLFTLLSGQSVTLPYRHKNGSEIELETGQTISGIPEPHEFVVPQSWRIFATMNTYDKTSLYEMSYAFMRRFAFIRVAAPDLRDDDELVNTVRRYVNVWDHLDPHPDELEAVAKVWQATNTAIEERAIGPALIEDMFRYVIERRPADLEDRLTDAVISYIFPQLEGVPDRRKILKEIAAVDEVRFSLIEDASRDMLQVPGLNDG